MTAQTTVMAPSEKMALKMSLVLLTLSKVFPITLPRSRPKLLSSPASKSASTFSCRSASTHQLTPQFWIPVGVPETGDSSHMMQYSGFETWWTNFDFHDLKLDLDKFKFFSLNYIRNVFCFETWLSDFTVQCVQTNISQHEQGGQFRICYNVAEILLWIVLWRRERLNPWSTTQRNIETNHHHFSLCPSLQSTQTKVSYMNAPS